MTNDAIRAQILSWLKGGETFLAFESEHYTYRLVRLPISPRAAYIFYQSSGDFLENEPTPIHPHDLTYGALYDSKTEQCLFREKQGLFAAVFPDVPNIIEVSARHSDAMTAYIQKAVDLEKVADIAKVLGVTNHKPKLTDMAPGLTEASTPGLVLAAEADAKKLVMLGQEPSKSGISPGFNCHEWLEPKDWLAWVDDPDSVVEKNSKEYMKRNAVMLLGQATYRQLLHDKWACVMADPDPETKCGIRIREAMGTVPKSAKTFQVSFKWSSSVKTGTLNKKDCWKSSGPFYVRSGEWRYPVGCSAILTIEYNGKTIYEKDGSQE